METKWRANKQSEPVAPAWSMDINRERWAGKLGERPMARKKVDCDWRLYELSPEDLEMILNDASTDGEDALELDDCREGGGGRV